MAEFSGRDAGNALRDDEIIDACVAGEERDGGSCRFVVRREHIAARECRLHEAIKPCRRQLGAQPEDVNRQAVGFGCVAQLQISVSSTCFATATPGVSASRQNSANSRGSRSSGLPRMKPSRPGQHVDAQSDARGAGARLP